MLAYAIKHKLISIFRGKGNQCIKCTEKKWDTTRKFGKKNQKYKTVTIISKLCLWENFSLPPYAGNLIQLAFPENVDNLTESMSLVSGHMIVSKLFLQITRVTKLLLIYPATYLMTTFVSRCISDKAGTSIQN